MSEEPRSNNGVPVAEVPEDIPGGTASAGGKKPPSKDAKGKKPRNQVRKKAKGVGKNMLQVGDYNKWDADEKVAQLVKWAQGLGVHPMSVKLGGLDSMGKKKKAAFIKAFIKVRRKAGALADKEVKYCTEGTDRDNACKWAVGIFNSSKDPKEGDISVLKKEYEDLHDIGTACLWLRGETRVGEENKESAYQWAMHRFYDRERDIHQKAIDGEAIPAADLMDLRRNAGACSWLNGDGKTRGMAEGDVPTRMTSLSDALGPAVEGNHTLSNMDANMDAFETAVGLAAFDAFNDKLKSCPENALYVLNGNGDDKRTKALEKLDELKELYERCKSILDSVGPDGRFAIVQNIKTFYENHIAPIFREEDVKKKLEDLAGCRADANQAMGDKEIAKLTDIKGAYKIIHDEHKDIRARKMGMASDTNPVEKAADEMGIKIKQPRAKADAGNGEVEDLIKQIEMELKNKK